MVINPLTPMYNTILFYIILICIILIVKPKSMYNQKTRRFKSFGCGKDKTLLSFPVICISAGVALYMVFLLVKILYIQINK